jgi:phosphohistidine phosphatase
MKTLYMVRHAKSSWGDFTTPDFDRPLNERGKKDAPVMAERLKNKNPGISVFISSPAKRAMKTCKAFCKEYGYDENNIVFKEELYHASVDTFYKVISNIAEEHPSAVIFSHNPGITEFVNSLNTEVKLDNMPTCGIYGVSAEAEHWADFKKAEKKCILFDYPKLSGGN